ncbi:MAG: peptide-methionine (S)-S-oxide reductase MsrA [Bacteroidota bacterium]
MKIFFTTIVLCTALVSCAQKEIKKTEIPVGTKKTAGTKEAVATFAQGCVWHTEIVFQSLDGVRDAVSGYAGGSVNNPDYETVCTGKTGHAESVQVFYNPDKISYTTLVSAFFASHDPTQLNRQGNDVGNHYRSVAFYNNTGEKQIIEAEIKRLSDKKAFKKNIVTQVSKAGQFYPAEAYHQEYILNNPTNGYVQNVSIPDFLHFKKTFKGRFKE